MTRQYFGTDGIRGTVGQPPITPDFVLRLAHAVGRVLKRGEARPTVLIGKDTRISGYMLEAALESGFNSAGVDVVLLGPVPTPAVAYLTRAQRASLGVVISASHNPFDDNGIKFFSALGTKLPDAWELAVEAALEDAPVWVDSANLGKARRLNDADGRYIEFCKSTFANDLSLRGMKLVVDASGRLFNGDELLYLMVNERIARGERPRGVVGTLMTNKAVEMALRAQGIEFVRAKVGDRYVLEELDKRGWLLGGEGSGHLLALDRHTTGDGIVSALQVLQACVRSGKTVAQLLEGVTLFPQTLINVRLAPGQDWKSNTALASETKRIEAELGDAGRVLIRASGTEPLVRVMVEARDAKQSQSCAERLAATLKPAA